MPQFTSKECAWSHFTLKMLGRTVNGLLEFSFKKGVDKEHLYAAGPDPIDIQTGNRKPEGNIKVLKYELDMLNDAAQAAGYEDIAEVPHEAITITGSFKKFATSETRIMEAFGVAISEYSVGMSQNAKSTEVSLPFLCMKVTARKI